METRAGEYIGETLGPRRNGRVDSVCLDGIRRRTKRAMGGDFTSVTLKTKLAENVTAFALIIMDNQTKFGLANFKGHDKVFHHRFYVHHKSGHPTLSRIRKTLVVFLESALSPWPSQAHWHWHTRTIPS